MADAVLLAAAGRGRLQEALAIAGRKPFVVFAALDGSVLVRMEQIKNSGARVEVFLYETG